MKIFSLLLILPAIAFSQNSKTVVLKSGTTLHTLFNNPSGKSNTTGTYTQDLNYSYKTNPGFYLSAGIETGVNRAKRFNVTVPMSIGFKEFKTELTTSGTANGCFLCFYGTETKQSTGRYGSLMAGPKFNFNFQRLSIYTAINANVDIFLYGETKTTYNNVPREVNTDFKIEGMKSEDVNLNSGLEIGVDYPITDHLQVGVSAEAYFSRLNNLMLGTGPYLFNYSDYQTRSSMLFCGVRLGYNF